MTSFSIKEEITNYIQQDDVPGALLLTGKWGSAVIYDGVR